MNIITWNINGVRANERKGIFSKLFISPRELGFTEDALDIIAFQETKANYSELDNLFSPEGYNVYHNSANERKGYSGTAVYVKKGIKSDILPLNSIEFVSFETLKTEGRLICVEFKGFFLINCYFPNGGGKDDRLEYKIKFYQEFTRFCKKLEMLHKKHIIFCGDLNIAHNEIDLARPKQNENHIGFLRKERDLLDVLHKEGFSDVFRSMYPNKVGYSWWDMKSRARDRNIGWRIDGFYVDSSFMGNIKDVQILDQIEGSDHCPVLLHLK